MRITDLRSGVNVWERGDGEKFENAQVRLDEVLVRTNYGYEVAFNRYDLNMLQGVVARLCSPVR